MIAQPVEEDLEKPAPPAETAVWLLANRYWDCPLGESVVAYGQSVAKGLRCQRAKFPRMSSPHLAPASRRESGLPLPTGHEGAVGVTGGVLGVPAPGRPLAVVL